MMKNRTFILFVLLVISVVGNIWLLSKIQKFKKIDIKQEQIFTEVADSLECFRMQRDSIKNIDSSDSNNISSEYVKK